MIIVTPASVTLADVQSTLSGIADVSRTIAGILAGLIAVLGVPLALRQVVNLQREMRRYETESRRRLDAEANLNITAHPTLTRPVRDLPHVSHAGQHSYALPRVDEPAKRVLRLDLTLENVGEGSVDVLACLVAARELERQGDEVVEGGRDVQWSDLTTHYWDGDERCISPGLSTHKHIVYAQDALARIKAHSRKTLARIDQLRERSPEEDLYLLYRAFVVVCRSSRSVEHVQAWASLQRALLNVNAPAFRAAAGEHDPLGLVASADGWRLFLQHYERLADPKLPQLRAAADREEAAATNAESYRQTRERVEAELRDYCTRTLLPAWQRFRADYDRMTQQPAGFLALMAERDFRRRQREAERRFPWTNQEVWTEYFYVTVREEAE